MALLIILLQEVFTTLIQDFGTRQFEVAEK